MTKPNASLLLTFNILHRDELLLSDRAYSASADHSDEGGFDLRSWDTYPGFFEFVAPRRNPGNLFIIEDHLWIFWGDGTQEALDRFERFNQNDGTTAVSGADRLGFAAISHIELGNNLEFFTEFSFQANESHFQLAPAAFTRRFTIPASNPYNPTFNFGNPTFGPFIPPEGVDVTDALLRPTDSRIRSSPQK